MSRTRKLTVVVAGDTKGMSSALSDTERKASGLGSKFAKLGKMAAVGLGGAAVAGVALGKSFVDAAVESQKVTAQTAAVIKSMGGVANVSASQVAKLSTALSLKTGVDDEVIQSGQNVLLTFGNIKNAIGDGPKVFDRATRAALDMSVALGQDMSSAAMMVGKALNDPVKGLSKLARSGIQFTKQQEDQIKAMVKAGDTAGAQAVMLKELERQFGGSAAAQATAGDKLKVAWGNLQEQLGEKLLPVVEKVAGFLAKNLPRAFAAVGRVLGPIAKQISMFWNALTSGFTEDEGTRIEMIALRIRAGFQALASFVMQKVVPALKSMGDWFIKHKPVLLGVAAAIGVGLVSAFVAWAASATAAAVATVAATWPILAIGAAIAALVAGVIYAYQNWGWFHDAVNKVASFLTGTLWPALKKIAGWITGTLVPTVGSIISKFVEWGRKVGEIAGVIIAHVQRVISWVRSNWPLILGILTGPIGLAVLAISKNWDKIKSGATAVRDWVMARFRDVVGFISGLPGKITSATAGMWDGIATAFRGAINKVIDIWNGLEFKIGGQKVFGKRLPGVTISTPNLPKLHGGAIFNSGRGEGPALLKDGEGVFTPGQMAALAPVQSFQPVPVIIELDGQVLGRAMIRFDADHKARNGRSAFGG